MIARLQSLGAMVAAGLLMAACSQSEETEKAAAPPRPVLSVVVAKADTQTIGFSGTVEPRFETTLAFRTLGRIVAREVDVGDRVEKGQTLAAIDAESLAADLRSTQAQLSNARIQAETAEASARRTRQLFEENTASQSELDRVEQNLASAEAELVNARAQVDKAENALSYTVLTAPFAGVITDREADVGQVVAAGATVMTLARTDQREAVVDIPAAETSRMEKGSPFRVVLQIEPSLTASGAIREIAPQADALTRTNRVRILLDDPPEAFRIGALVTAVPLDADAQSSIFLPASAVFREDDEAKVWVVDPDTRTVHKRAITLSEGVPAPSNTGQVTVTEGLAPGDRVVTAGVNELEEAQAVSIPADGAA